MNSNTNNNNNNQWLAKKLVNNTKFCSFLSLFAIFSTRTLSFTFLALSTGLSWVLLLLLLHLHFILHFLFLTYTCYCWTYKLLNNSQKIKQKKNWIFSQTLTTIQLQNINIMYIQYIYGVCVCVWNVVYSRSARLLWLLDTLKMGGPLWQLLWQCQIKFHFIFFANFLI